MADAGWAIQDFSVRTKKRSTHFHYRLTESFLKEMEDQFEDFLSHQPSGRIVTSKIPWTRKNANTVLYDSNRAKPEKNSEQRRVNFKNYFWKLDQN